MKTCQAHALRVISMDVTASQLEGQGWRGESLIVLVQVEGGGLGGGEQASRFLVGRGPLGSHFYLCPSFCLFSLKHSFLYFAWSEFELPCSFSSGR